jgi:predicted dehydrogenase
MTASENPAYPATGEASCLIGGTLGSLALPGLRMWHDHRHRNWWHPIVATHLPFVPDDPLIAQVRQFAAVIRGTARPLASGRDGLQALAVVEAIKRSARDGMPQRVADWLEAKS